MKLQNLLSALSFQSGHNTVSFSKRWKEIHGNPHYVSGVHAWAQLCWQKTPPLRIFNLTFKSLSCVTEHHQIPKQVGAMTSSIPEGC